jgi:pilus assembly protein CpaE
VAVILVAEDEVSASRRRAHLAGAKDILVWPFTQETLVNSIGAALAARPIPAPPPLSGQPDEAPPGPAEPARGGRVTSIFRAKGGVGASVLAVNLAAAMAAEAAGRIGLFDLDCRYGDLAGILGVERLTSLGRAIEAGVSPIDLASLLSEAQAGISLLTAALSPGESDHVSPVHVLFALEKLRDSFAQTIVDCGGQVDRRALTAIENSDEVLVVTDPDPASVRNTRLALGTLERLGIPTERVLVVINRAHPGSALNREDISRMLGRTVVMELPREDDFVQQSILQATPIVTLYPDSELSRRVRELASSFVHATR